MAKKYVYAFSETNESMRNLCGGKGANLGQMTQLGLPIPQGFTVTTEACTKYYKDGEQISTSIQKEILDAVKALEKLTGKKFGDPKNPLLVSVRSGARVSMPGMMDTILNLGLNPNVVDGLSQITGNRRFANDSYRRFIQMYSDVVMGVEKRNFENIIDELKAQKGVAQDSDFTAEDLDEMIARFKELYKKEIGEEFPTDPFVQLFGAIGAVFKSWNNPRADYYRKMNNIPSSWGTAVNVQSMVFGNFSDKSGTGVAFTRHPSTGEAKVFGEYLINAQGEDVVAGIRTPQALDTLKDVMPACHAEFMRLAALLEEHFRDMQDIEFTIENEKLYFLQTRNGKRTAPAALKIAVDLVNEGKITKEQAITRVEPAQLENLLHPHFSSSALKTAKLAGKGLPASPGAATGQVAFSVAEVLRLKSEGKKSVLVRLETSPEDIEGMHVAEGFLTARGGMTSHAAVVARGMGKTCVAGCHDLQFLSDGTCRLGGLEVKEGDYISIDGSTGSVYLQEIETVPAEISGDFETFMGWVDEVRTLGVRANAETPKDARQAILFGAEGIGLIRTEHMFFDSTRIKAIREFIVSATAEQRKVALERILPYQQKDFEDLIETVEGRAMTIRYLDPPLHEFIPKEAKEIEELARELKVELKELYSVIASLHEENPMMGNRGCRLAVRYPELAEMQTKAVITAYIAQTKKHPEWKLVPEIMIPLVGELREFQFVKQTVCRVADQLIKEAGVDLEYKVGTMIEIPRAAILADKIAKEADFFSFGTNDLTQLTFGFSRDDAANFLPAYYENKIYEFDPFQQIDPEGVGELVKLATKLGKKGNKTLKLGVCGEHGGNPFSVEFFHNAGITYVSCSPFRVPVARLAAAQAELKNPRKK